MRYSLLFTMLFTLFLTLSAQAEVHHQLNINLHPSEKTLSVTDRITVTGPSLRFRIHKNLQVGLLSAGDQIRPLPSPADALYQDYELILGPEDTEVHLQYAGIIYEPVSQNESSGLITPEGAVLFGSSYWLPDFLQNATYEILKIQMPADWRLASPAFQKRIPQPSISLIAGPFVEHTFFDPRLRINFNVFLKTEDKVLSGVFFNLLSEYATHYENTLGKYPYESFSVIENFWETGYGLPGMTLLGPTVIRLPHILNSSLPHELLHNWWGNSVFVNYERGNWCEGLTTYLADHWQQELLKKDRDYRLQALINYQDYTKTTADFPLRQFIQRFNFGSQAIGYGKGMMVFHMLRKKLGDEVFNRALKQLYVNHVGQSISWEEIETSFESTSGVSLKNYFKQWLDRKGAPSLKLSNAQQSALSTQSYKVNFELSQISAENYELLVPVRFVFASGEVTTEMLELNSTSQSFAFTFTQSLQSLEIDPEVDVFRNLDPQERPLGLSNIFGEKNLWLIGTSSDLQDHYLQTWQPNLSGTLTRASEDLLQNLPEEGAVVLLGDSPAYEKLMLEALKGQDIKTDADHFYLMGAAYGRLENKMAFVARPSTRPGLTLLWIRGEAIQALAPRLLHYGKYGVLVFNATGVPVKTTWPLLSSPLKITF